jgi:hypothetical protein
LLFTLQIGVVAAALQKLVFQHLEEQFACGDGDFERSGYRVVSGISTPSVRYNERHNKVSRQLCLNEIV